MFPRTCPNQVVQTKLSRPASCRPFFNKLPLISLTIAHWDTFQELVLSWPDQVLVGFNFQQFAGLALIYNNCQQ